jgi:hypothetical protein
VDDVKTQESRKQLVIASELLGALKTWKQASEFSEPSNWIFASPIHNGKMPWSDDQVWRLYQKAPKQRVSAVLVLTAFASHTYRSLLDRGYDRWGQATADASC